MKTTPKNQTSKKMIIKPRGAWLLVEPLKPLENAHGIKIPDSVDKGEQAQGIVLAVGPKVEGIKKGEKVLYGKYAGEDLQTSNKFEVAERVDYKLLLDEDILAIIEN